MHLQWKHSLHLPKDPKKCTYTVGFIRSRTTSWKRFWWLLAVKSREAVVEYATNEVETKAAIEHLRNQLVSSFTTAASRIWKHVGPTTPVYIDFGGAKYTVAKPGDKIKATVKKLYEVDGSKVTEKESPKVDS